VPGGSDGGWRRLDPRANRAAGPLLHGVQVPACPVLDDTQKAYHPTTQALADALEYSPRTVPTRSGTCIVPCKK
jgi:hypothetical protein